VLRIVVLAGVGALLFWLVIRGYDFAAIREKLSRTRWQWAALSLLFAAFSNLLRAARWNLLIHPLGDRPRLATAFGAVVVGYMANLALPRLGEVTRCVVVNRYEGTPIEALLGTVVTERICDVLTVLLCLGLLLLLAFDRMASMASQYVIDPIMTKLAGVTRHGPLIYLSLAILVLAIWVIGRTLLAQPAGSTRTERLRRLARGFADGLRTVGRLERRTQFVLYSASIWLCYALMAWACFRCFPATEHLGPTAALAVLVFSGIGFAAPVQGGLGAFELVVTPAVAAFGVPSSDALTYAILYHATQVVGMLGFGMIALVTLPLMDRRSRGEPSGG